MEQNKINQEVSKIINVMLNCGDKISNDRILVLDMQKGFLFYNSSEGWLYKGMSLLNEPNYLTGEVKRTSEVFNYTTRKTKKGNHQLHKDRSLKDLKQLYNQIIEI